MAARVRALAAWARRRGRTSPSRTTPTRRSSPPARLGIRTVTAMDYEHQPANHLGFRLANTVLLPEALRQAGVARQGATPGQDALLRRAEGGDLPRRFRARREAALRDAGVERAAGAGVLVVARTPPSGALYHRSENPLFGQILGAIGDRPDVRCVVLCRHPEQRRELAAAATAEPLPTRARSRRSLAPARRRPGDRGRRDDDARGRPARRPHRQHLRRPPRGGRLLARTARPAAPARLSGGSAAPAAARTAAPRPGRPAHSRSTADRRVRSGDLRRPRAKLPRSPMAEPDRPEAPPIPRRWRSRSGWSAGAGSASGGGPTPTTGSTPSAARSRPLKRRALGRRLLTQAVKRSPLDLRPLLGIPTGAERGRRSPGWRPPTRAAASSSGRWRKRGCGRRCGRSNAPALPGLRGALLGLPLRRAVPGLLLLAAGPRTRSPPPSPASPCSTPTPRSATPSCSPRLAGSASSSCVTIPQTRPIEPGAYFGYLPGDRSPIHNSSLLVASLLARLAAEAGDERFAEPAAAAVLLRDGPPARRRLLALRRAPQPRLGRQLPHRLRARRPASLRRRRHRGGRGRERPGGAGSTYYRRELFLADGTPKYYPRQGPPDRRPVRRPGDPDARDRRPARSRRRRDGLAACSASRCGGCAGAMACRSSSAAASGPTGPCTRAGWWRRCCSPSPTC